MNRPHKKFKPSAAEEWLVGGGEMGKLIRSMDWSRTPLGPIESWPQSLRTALNILLTQQHPMFIYWGPELIQFYNDGYRPILGTTMHPAAMGQRGRECWKEIWEIIWPMMEEVFAGGSTYVKDGLLCLNRHGFLEEGYYNYAYSPIRDETGHVAGIFVACSESTGRVIGERRLKLLGDLGSKASESKSPAQACETAARVLSAAGADFPFALIYRLTSPARADRAGIAGIENGSPAAAPSIFLDGAKTSPWPIEEALKTGKPVLVENLESRFGKLPGGPWPEPPKSAFVLPLVHPGSGRASGAVVVGISPRLALDEQYKSFLELVAGHISTAINNARAYEEERRRAEALAELDRVKTEFFSNVSHEFRTPLTLMLGPLEEALADTIEPLPPGQRDRIDLVRRNSQRLLKLVNTLLDFSRIEAGRAQASYEPTDLAAFTCELAGVFRSAVEKAGLRLIVDCPSLPQPVYVDREMWEKIVLNLLSNAFKFTFEGEIEVAMRWKDDHVELRVRDTGVGIPKEELPHLFERFHRVKGTRARTHEGSGIGLALVQELIRLHGGRINVESLVERGTTFTLSIPAGSSHLPADRLGAVRTLGSTTIGATPYAEEAARWLPEERRTPDILTYPSRISDLRVYKQNLPPQTSSALILLADDNSDMREYVRRLLSSRWKVETAADGLAALEAARERPPDLILSDVMMPGLDGFQLLRALRNDPRTREIPFIMLSARAGEESRVEGLEAGADAYLAKPFSARELMAQVGAHLELARVRREASFKEQKLRAEAEAAQELSRVKSDLVSNVSHELRTPLNAIIGYTSLLRDETYGDLVEDQKQPLEGVLRNAEALLHLINDLLDLSKIESGKMSVQLNKVNLAALLREVLSGLQPLIEEKALSVEFRLSTLPEIESDANKIRQVFVNVIANAIKFTEKGVITIFAEEKLKEGIEISVQDTGIGILPSELPMIFDPFHQADGTATRPFGGTGLGLAIVKKLLDLLKGRINVESDPAQGSTFRVFLPFRWNKEE